MLRLESEGPWMCDVRHLWKDSPAAERISKDMRKVNGEEWEYSDRCQADQDKVHQRGSGAESRTRALRADQGLYTRN